MSRRYALRSRPWLALPILAAALCQPAARGEQPTKQLLAVEDLYRFDRPHASALSPDGKRLVYERRWIDRTSKRERYALWLAEEGKAPRPLETDEPDGRAPVFSPDGKWVAFLSTRHCPLRVQQLPPTPAASDPATDVWLWSVERAQAYPLAGKVKPHGRVFNDGFYGRLTFAPDGRRLAFVADDGKDPRTKEEIDNEVEIVRPDQGEGYTGYGPAQLWLADLFTGPDNDCMGRAIERLTKDDVWYGDPQWSPDGQSLVVHANKTDDRESVRYSINKNYDLWAIDRETKKQRQLTTGPGPEVSPRFAPDGKRLVCLSIPRKGSHRDVFNLAVVTLGEGGPRTELVFDHHGPSADQPPYPSPAFPLPDDCWLGRQHVLFNAEAGTATSLNQVDLTTGKGAVLVQPTVAKDQPIDVKDPVGRLARRRQLTPPGDLFLRERVVAASKVLSWDNGEGQRIEGVLTLPPHAKPPFKLVLWPHGGPHSRSTPGFSFSAQVFAAQGYAVFQPNFRGSSGYGQKFIDADHADFGGGDMRDILTGIDHLVKEGLIDRERQFVYGTSYGGFMTCWLVGHTKQFRAAVAQNAVTDLNAMWGLSDLQSWTEWEFGGRPWEVPGRMRQHSPLTYAASVQTPTLILHARDDRRCPLPMGRMFHQALLARKVPTQMVIYPNEGHGIRQPRHQEDVLRRALAWFERHDGK